MKNKTRTITRLTRYIATLVFAASFLPYAQGALAANGMVVFKLDPRLTRSLYMGDRWVSPQTFTQVQEKGKGLTVEGRSDSGTAWTASDPAMLTVKPAGGDVVSITVNGPGQSTLTVGSRTLAVAATYVANGILRVDISQ